MALNGANDNQKLYYSDIVLQPDVYDNRKSPQSYKVEEIFRINS